MSGAKMLNIDGEALKALLLDRGLSLGDASERIMASRRYLEKCVLAGQMSVHAASALEFATGIKREKYEVTC